MLWSVQFIPALISFGGYQISSESPCQRYTTVFCPGVVRVGGGHILTPSATDIIDAKMIREYVASHVNLHPICRPSKLRWVPGQQQCKRKMF